MPTQPISLTAGGTAIGASGIDGNACLDDADIHVCSQLDVPWQATTSDATLSTLSYHSGTDGSTCPAHIGKAMTTAAIVVQAVATLRAGASCRMVVPGTPVPSSLKSPWVARQRTAYSKDVSTRRWLLAPPARRSNRDCGCHEKGRGHGRALFRGSDGRQWHNRAMLSLPRSLLPLALFRLLLAGLLCWLLLSVLAVLGLRFLPVPTSGFMVERWLHSLVGADKSVDLRQRWTPIDHVSDALPIALVAAEDQKFPIHHGFDLAAIRTALDDAEDGERLRGASTITQQVAKNLFLWNGRSFVRKGIEAYYTVLIEALWPKRRIIEVYLNIAEFGDGIYGADAASRTYFGVAPSQLTARQSALLAAVLPNPRRYSVKPPSPYVQRRAAWIERQANQLGGAAYLKAR